jgi:spermidine synthase
VTLVDLDRQMTTLFKDAPLLAGLNAAALSSPRLTVVNQDALKWLEGTRERFDFIVVDFPDPSNFSLGKLYSSAFYRLLRQHLSADGLIAVQSTSPLVARKSYWCVVTTLESVGLAAWPYHATVPSFGAWGFILAGRGAYRPPESIPVPTRFLTPAVAATLFEFPADMARVPAEVNRLDNQVLVRTFEQEWRSVLR